MKSPVVSKSILILINNKKYILMKKNALYPHLFASCLGVWLVKNLQLANVQPWILKHFDFEISYKYPEQIITAYHHYLL